MITYRASPGEGQVTQKLLHLQVDSCCILIVIVIIVVILIIWYIIIRREHGQNNIFPGLLHISHLHQK